jgi:GntR family histidine utilization transcriptional repressor
VHRAGGAPFVLEQRLINLASVPEARTEAFVADPPGTWLQARLPWTDAEHHILALNADAAIAERLGVILGSACLCDDRRSWRGGLVVTHVRLTYPGDRQLVAHFHAPGRKRRAG